mmetsp:Transcript_30666/g.56037  ORF Transcript_30666/g.56037 Transcript_30666/m.56037 type:complete len:446 (-) Transcript_30666:27-1364(-)
MALPSIGCPRLAAWAPTADAGIGQGVSLVSRASSLSARPEVLPAGRMSSLVAACATSAAALLHFHKKRTATKAGARHGYRVALQAAAGEETKVVPGAITKGPKMKVVVFGASGYIGRAVVDELLRRGHSVVAFTREKAGIGGAENPDDLKERFNGAEVVVGDVTSEDSISKVLGSMDTPADAFVCCLASRSGGPQDSLDIDYQATVNCMKAAVGVKAKHFVLLSAVCVQRPKLVFQEAKLKAEEELRKLGESINYSIVRPTAFFKSLLGQVKGVQGGAPFVMFGDGTEVKCKPISEEDLASFIADCLWDPAKKNAVLPIGGPGPALSFKEQGEMLFKLLDKEPSFICVPYGVFDVVQAGLDGLANLSPDTFSDAAEYGRIGRYYAEESMLVLDEKTGEYSGELTPGYGRTSLKDFLVEALAEGSTKLDDQKLGDQSVSERLGMSE